jgi:GNAT superfamily N-acetyltransferase
MMMESTFGDYIISTDKSKLDVDLVHEFLRDRSYWAAGRTREQMKNAIANSICFGVYRDGNQVGFARVVSDGATFAYVGDVFVLEEHRGKGVGRMLMETMLAYPDLQGLRRWILATRDAHGLYEQFGFTRLKFPERWMELAAPEAY